jgi:sugar phosphate isomerase/epimerase
MRTIKGPAIFLAQFAADEAPFNSLDSIAESAASLGFVGVQMPSWDARLFDLEKSAGSKTYCDEVLGTLEKHWSATDGIVDPLAGPVGRGASGIRSDV